MAVRFTSIRLAMKHGITVFYREDVNRDRGLSVILEATWFRTSPSKTTKEPRLSVTFSLISSNILVRGNFNPYIFSPQWLIEHGVWDDEEVQLVLGAMGEGVRFRGVKSSIEWIVDAQTMVIGGPSDCGAIACKILELLPHTPVRAVGCNFAYSSPEWNSPLVPMLGVKAQADLPSEWNPELTKWSAVFHVDKSRIDMSVECGDQGITTSFNFHTGVDNAKSAETITRKFSEFRSIAEKLIATILESSVE